MTYRRGNEIDREETENTLVQNGFFHNKCYFSS